MVKGEVVEVRTRWMRSCTEERDERPAVKVNAKKF
jgi:hypothetical protein